MTNNIKPILPFKSKLIPVLTIDDIDKAGPLAKALYEGGLDVAEVTFRAPDADKAIAAMKKAVPNMLVGAGTILNRRDIDRAVDAGSDFLITPATTPGLLRVLRSCNIPVYPGTATPSEALALYELGYKVVKLFPAEAVGGIKLLKSIAPPLPHLKFIPTGGINAAKAPEYLSLPNVIAVGGSWMVDNTALKNKDWAGISASVEKALRAI